MVVAQEYYDQVEAITAAAWVQAWKGLKTRKYGLRIIVMPRAQRPGDVGPGNDCGGRWRDPTRKPTRGNRPDAGMASQSDAVTAEPAGRCSSPAAGGNSQGAVCPAFHGLAETLGAETIVEVGGETPPESRLGGTALTWGRRHRVTRSLRSLPGDVVPRQPVGIAGGCVPGVPWPSGEAKRPKGEEQRE
ncbi:hypothetical protein NDU88_004980 [Pleurodeles waltl]|uniref:Uncharacterized protein n=1 Tax=Pleurodeles waltl TaxID=8319 RepID=A0AAV7RMH3_PLEWA|nr:hypothetical protein NDU88_004980 [Pleurodeles waltl]